MKHSTSVRPNKKGEYQPTCSCGWELPACTVRVAANTWCQTHVANSKSTHLMPFKYNEFDSV